MTAPKKPRKLKNHFGDVLDAAMIPDNERCAEALVRALRRLARDAATMALETQEIGQRVADFDSVDVAGIARVLVPR